MKLPHIVMLAGLLAAGGAQAQMIEPATAPLVLQGAPARKVLRDLPSFPRTFAGFEGMSEHPSPFDVYRADPKLYAGVDFGPNLRLETRFTNPVYRENPQYVGLGPPDGNAKQLGVGGFNLDTAATLTVPVDDRLSAFAKVGVSYRQREQHGVTSASVGNLTSVGATYKLNSKQTLTAEAPLGALAKKIVSGRANGVAGSVRLGF